MPKQTLHALLLVAASLVGASSLHALPGELCLHKGDVVTGTYAAEVRLLKPASVDEVAPEGAVPIPAVLHIDQGCLHTTSRYFALVRKVDHRRFHVRFHIPYERLVPGALQKQRSGDAEAYTPDLVVAADAVVSPKGEVHLERFRHDTDTDARYLDLILDDTVALNRRPYVLMHRDCSQLSDLETASARTSAKTTERQSAACNKVESQDDVVQVRGLYDDRLLVASVLRWTDQKKQVHERWFHVAHPWHEVLDVMPVPNRPHLRVLVVRFQPASGVRLVSVDLSAGRIKKGPPVLHTAFGATTDVVLGNSRCHVEFCFKRRFHPYASVRVTTTEGAPRLMSGGWGRRPESWDGALATWGKGVWTVPTPPPQSSWFIEVERDRTF